MRKKLPDAPGVYFFLGRNKKVLYIGRATSLCNRVRSYFAHDIVEKRSSWIAKMLSEAKSVDFKKTDSVLEAILLEADLIKKFQPHYNTDEKDDKSFNCVVITKEDFPAIFVERSRNIDFQALKLKTSPPANRRAGNLKLLTIHGPFTNGFQLQTAMKIIRRIFPYRDFKCAPCSERQMTLKQHPNKLENVGVLCRPCFNRQIGLCPGVCTGEITKSDYAKVIRNLKLFFEGKKTRLLGLLKKEMKTAAKAQEFEKANGIKKTIFALQHIQDVALMKRNLIPPFQKEVADRPEDLKSLPLTGTPFRKGRISRASFRIEAYDLSHFGGKEIVGAMTVVENERALPAEYRLFKIRGIQSAHETAGLKEMLRRRFSHPEWTHPSLIVVDGNEVQRKAATSILSSLLLSIPIVAVVKDEKHRPREFLGENTLVANYRSAILLANSEAHRFALKFQKTRRTIP